MIKNCIFIFSVLVCSCSYVDRSKEIESMMNEVTSSTTVETEAANIEKVWSYILKNRISIQVFSVKDNGQEININTVSNISEIKVVKIIFEKDEMTTHLKWTPIDTNNIFILFRE